MYVCIHVCIISQEQLWGNLKVYVCMYVCMYAFMYECNLEVCMNVCMYKLSGAAWSNLECMYVCMNGI